MRGTVNTVCILWVNTICVLWVNTICILWVNTICISYLLYSWMTELLLLMRGDLEDALHTLNTDFSVLFAFML